jgi:carbamoyl-phosphate synthase large subunit
MSKIRTIVTGGGSIVGQGIAKALRQSDLPVTIICTDIAALNPGMIRADESVVMPPVESVDSLDIWLEEIRRLKANCLMIGSEYDLKFFSKHKHTIEQETGCIVVASPPETVAMADDKMRTADFLASHKLPFPKSATNLSLEGAQNWVSEMGFPVMLKPRSGTSARFVHVIQDMESLDYWFGRTPSPMLQEYLKPVSGEFGAEYTCSTFSLANGELLGPFVSLRTLRGGSSWIVEVKTDDEITGLMMAISKRISFVGSLNVQLMRTERGPVPFEFNARFSGTTPIRAFFGFNEPEMAIRSYVFGEKDMNPIIRPGVCVRYIDEIMLEGFQLSNSPLSMPTGIVNRWF